MDPRRPRWRNPFEPGPGRYTPLKEPTLPLGPRGDGFRPRLERIEEEYRKMRPLALQKTCQEI